MCIIPDRRRVLHPPYSHRILYVGHDLALLDFLQESLKACWTVRSASGLFARLLIELDIPYSILLFDEQLPDTTGLLLACFTRDFPHRQQTPIIIIKSSDEFQTLARTITHLLTPPQ